MTLAHRNPIAPNGFRTRLRAAISASKYCDSVSRLSREAGLGPNSLSNTLNNDAIDTTPNGPGIFAMARVAEKLGVSLDYLSGNSPNINPAILANAPFTAIMERTTQAARGQIVEAGAAPTPESLLRTFAKSGGRIEAFQSFLIYCDQYEPTKENDSRVIVRAVGRKSLASFTMGQDSAEVLQEALDNAGDPSLMSDLVADHKDAIKRGCTSTIKMLDFSMPNRPVRAKLDYIRVLLFVRDANNLQTVLNYSSVIVP